MSFIRGRKRSLARGARIPSHTVHLHSRGGDIILGGTHNYFIFKLIFFCVCWPSPWPGLAGSGAVVRITNERRESMAMAMAAMRGAAASLGPGAVSWNSKRFFLSSSSTTSRPHRRRLRAFPSIYLPDPSTSTPSLRLFRCFLSTVY